MAQPPIPLPAATVVLVRPDGAGRFEIYFNRRPDQMDTYAGVYVFPGGRVEKSDSSPAMLALTRGMTALEAQKKLGVDWQPEICLSYWIAAARELFEEAGIHFFVPDGTGSGPLPEAVAQRLASRRSSLQRGEIDLPAVLSAEKLSCDLARLSYFFHRITPEHYRVRFDTRFFLAVLPEGQVPLHASEEVTESLWLPPDAALSRAESGDYRMMPPTLAVLRNLTAHRSWDDLCQAFGVR